MSVYTARTTSILKNYVATNRDRIKQAINNKVRFELLRDQSLRKCLLNAADGSGGAKEYRDYVMMVRDDAISDADFLQAIQEGRDCVDLLKPKFTDLAQALISLNWLNKKPETILAYQTFLLDLLSAHNKYTAYAVEKLVIHFRCIPADQYLWKNGEPVAEYRQKLSHIHELLAAIVEVIPLSKEMVENMAKDLYPYYAKATYEYVAYVYNMFWLNEYWPHQNDNKIVPLILDKLIMLDVHAPRHDIEAAEFGDDEDGGDDDDDEEDEMFKMDLDGGEQDGGGGVQPEDDDQMKNELAETLDLCMEKVLNYVQSKYETEKKSWTSNSETYKLLLRCFERVILPTHNCHHVQFVLFYYCSFKVHIFGLFSVFPPITFPILQTKIAEEFANYCWTKSCDLNTPTGIRQAAVSYLASILSRSMYIKIDMVKNYLRILSDWIHQYIQRTDSSQNASSLRLHSGFYATCQAVFYVISFRSRELTCSAESKS